MNHDEQVRTHRNEARGVAGAHDLVGPQPDAHAVLLEHLLVEGDELHDEHLLAHVVVRLDDHGLQVPRALGCVRYLIGDLGIRKEGDQK